MIREKKEKKKIVLQNRSVRELSFAVTINLHLYTLFLLLPFFLFIHLDFSPPRPKLYTLPPRLPVRAEWLV
jgi:hypothetical protein